MTATDDTPRRTDYRTTDLPRPRPDAACGALGCGRTDDLGRVFRPDRGERVLCPAHRKHYLGVSS